MVPDVRVVAANETGVGSFTAARWTIGVGAGGLRGRGEVCGDGRGLRVNGARRGHECLGGWWSNCGSGKRSWSGGESDGTCGLRDGAGVRDGRSGGGLGEGV